MDSETRDRLIRIEAMLTTLVNRPAEPMHPHCEGERHISVPVEGDPCLERCINCGFVSATMCFTGSNSVADTEDRLRGCLDDLLRG